jgi:membrane protein DedA with SNARE-associated domain
MFFESLLIPIPSEITMPFSGFLVSQGKLDFTLVVLTGTFANLLGSLGAYFLGYFLEETILLHLIRKYAKFILLTEREYLLAKNWFEKYGDKIIFISRLLPGIRTVISLPAGIFMMNIKKFIVYTFVGCLIWSILLTYLGLKLGENWKILSVYFKRFDLFIAILLLLMVILYIWKKFKH